MRLALTCLLIAAATSAPTVAHADGELLLRGNYWRDRNTRIIAPEAVVRKTTPGGTTVEASYLLDAITSASVSAGVLGDSLFTELRNEVGGRIAQVVGPATLSALYRYSTESDYWAHTAGGGVLVDLFKKNLTLGANWVYSRADIARRVSADGYVWAHGREPNVRNYDNSALETHFISLSAAQVLSQRALLTVGVDFANLDGYQANPYRSAIVSGSPVKEVLPSYRLRVAVAAGVRWTPVYHRGLVDHLTLYGGYRFYGDAWDVKAHTPEVRVYLGLGPTELRFTVRYHTQTAAYFYSPRGVYNTPFSDRNLCKEGCYTSDSKLSAFDSVFGELRFSLQLRAIFGSRNAASRWLGGGNAGVSAGYYANDGDADLQFGHAWVGGLDLALPL